MKKIIVALCALSLTACASNPDKIGAAYVSPLQYANYNCDQVREEFVRISSRVNEVAGAQRREATNDAIAMGVGLVVFWPALFFLAGGNDRKDELSRLKGEYESLERTAIEKQCSVAQELSSQKETAQASKK